MNPWTDLPQIFTEELETRFILFAWFKMSKLSG